MRRNRDERNNSWAKGTALKISRILVSIAPRSALGAEVEIDSGSREFYDSFGYSAEHFPMPFSKLISSANELKCYLLIERALLMKKTTSQYVNLQRLSGETLACHVVVTTYSNRKPEDPSTFRLQAVVTIRSASVVANSLAVGTLLFEPAEQTPLIRQTLEEYIGGEPSKYQVQDPVKLEAVKLETVKLEKEQEKEECEGTDSETETFASSASSYTSSPQISRQQCPQHSQEHLELPPALPIKSSRPLTSSPSKPPRVHTRPTFRPLALTQSQIQMQTFSAPLPLVPIEPTHLEAQRFAEGYVTLPGYQPFAPLDGIQAHLQTQTHSFFQQLLHRQTLEQAHRQGGRQRVLGLKHELVQASSKMIKVQEGRKRQKRNTSPLHISLPQCQSSPYQQECPCPQVEVVTPPRPFSKTLLPLRPQYRVRYEAPEAANDMDDDAFHSALELLCAQDDDPPSFKRAALECWEEECLPLPGLSMSAMSGGLGLAGLLGQGQGLGPNTVSFQVPHIQAGMGLDDHELEYHVFDELDTSSLLELDAFDI